MASADQLRKAHERYPQLVTGGDLEGILALYAEDATIEDPIGSELQRGHDAIRAFYAPVLGSTALKQAGPACVAGHESAMPIVALIGPEGQQALDIISVLRFNDDGRIASMRAYWSMDAMRESTPEERAR